VKYKDSIEQLASKIAYGHAFKQHVRPGLHHKKNEFEHLSISSKKDFKTHIERVLKDPKTQFFRGGDDQIVFYHPATHTIVIEHNRNSDGGTSYLSDNGNKRFKNLCRIQENIWKEQPHIFKHTPVIEKGGYKSAHHEYTINKAKQLKRQSRNRDEGRER